jgi:hypothetical protein
MSRLTGCQPSGPALTRITAGNYLTAIPDPKTLGEAYVSDPDHVLDLGTTPALNAHLDSLDRSGRAHIDVVLVRRPAAMASANGTVQHRKAPVSPVPKPCWPSSSRASTRV